MNPFKIGDKVKLSSLGIMAKMQGRAKRPTGVVTGVHPLSADLVRVRKYGQKSHAIYATVFWEKR